MADRRRGRFQDEIELQVDGPPSIIPIPISAKAKMKETWGHFLSRNGVKLTTTGAVDQVVIRTYNGYKSTSKKPGWTAELNEPVEQFINKFERTKSRYSVRLAFKHRLPLQSRSRRVVPPITTTTTGPSSTSASIDHRLLNAPRVILTRTPINLQGGPNNQQQSTAKLIYRTGTTPAINQVPSPQHRQRRPRPSFVIPTGRGGGGGPSTSSSTSEIYRKPRYTPGIINGRGSPRGSTQNRYATRLKGLIALGGIGGGRGGGRGHHLNGPLPPPPRGQGQEGAGRQDNLPEDLVGVKLERVEEDDDEEMEDDEEVDEEVDEVDGVEVDDDNLSLTSTASSEERQLIRDGIQVEDVKTKATERLEMFNNSYLLRMQKEVGDLRKSEFWIRNVERAPLACFLLQEVLKEEN